MINHLTAQYIMIYISINGVYYLFESYGTFNDKFKKSLIK